MFKVNQLARRLEAAAHSKNNRTSRVSVRINRAKPDPVLFEAPQHLELMAARLQNGENSYSVLVAQAGATGAFALAFRGRDRGEDPVVAATWHADGKSVVVGGGLVSSPTAGLSFEAGRAERTAHAHPAGFPNSSRDHCIRSTSQPATFADGCLERTKR